MPTGSGSAEQMDRRMDGFDTRLSGLDARLRGVEVAVARLAGRESGGDSGA